MIQYALPATVPLAGDIISVILQMISFGILTVCLGRRMPKWNNFKSLPLAIWLILIIHIDSAIFIFIAAILTRGFGINASHRMCDVGILLCLLSYLSTKVLIHFFLVEQAYIIRGSRLPRLKTQLWLFNCICLICPYVGLVVFNVIYRVAYLNNNGVCVIGMDKMTMIPLIAFDIFVNIYLILLFIVPLRELYSYQHKMNESLRNMAYRSLIGSCTTLISRVVNLTVLLILNGEPEWICFICCNADILFTVVVLHWITQIRRPSPASSPVLPQRDWPTRPDHVVHFDIPEPSTPGTTSNRASNRASVQMWTAGKRRSDMTKSLSTTITTVVTGGLACREKEVREEEEGIEMKGIMVLTERTQEIEVGMDAECDVCACDFPDSNSPNTTEKILEDYAG